MRPVPLVIHICGWPGSGKQAIGTALAYRIGGRLIDNHLMIDPASAIYDRGDSGHSHLRAQVREAVFEHALKLSLGVPIIFTNALADTPADHGLYAPFDAFAQQRGARLLAVTLVISEEENVKRLLDSGRIGRSKLMDRDVLLSHRAELELLRPEGAIDVCVDGLTAEQAADQIAVLCGNEVAHG